MSAAFQASIVGFAHDHMQANAEAHGAPEFRGLGPYLFDLLGDCGRWLAPGQHHLHLFGRQVLGRFGGTAEVQRRTRLLDRRVEQSGAFDADVLAVVIHGFAFQHAAPDAGEFHRSLVALFVTEEQAVAGQLFRVTTGHQVEQRTAAGQSIQGRGLTRRHRREMIPGRRATRNFKRWVTGISDAATSHESSQERPGGDQHPAKTQAVSSLGHLLQVTVINSASSFGGAKVMAVTVGRQEPENIEAHGVVS